MSSNSNSTRTFQTAGSSAAFFQRLRKLFILESFLFHSLIALRVSRNFLHCSIHVAAVLLIAGCAGQMAPSGGPPDTTPPAVVLSSPAARTLHFHDHTISLSFSKYVDRRSVQESIFFSPALGALTFDWGGTDVDIHFIDSLRASTTYVMTLGTDVVDTRGNRMAHSYFLPFSTGENIDSARISGMVYDANPEGVMIFCYQLNSRIPDTLNPHTSKPDYISQTGKDGSFAIPYLAFGTYRLYAVRDQYKNLLYDPQTDQYGTYTRDLTLTPDHAVFSNAQFRLTAEDTTPPFLSSAREIDQNHVLLKFSEAIDPLTVVPDSIRIVDTTTGARLRILDLSFSDPPCLEAPLVTEPQRNGAGYRLTLTGTRDLEGNVMQAPRNTDTFAASDVSDTSKPTFESKTIHDLMKDVAVRDSFHFVFSEPVRKIPFEQGFVLFDTALVIVKGDFVWWYSTAVSFVPHPRLHFNTHYKIRIILDSLQDFEGNHFSDSSAVLRFETVDEMTLSGVRGSVVDGVPDSRGRITITAMNLTNKQVAPYTTVLAGPGAFVLDEMMEGQYVFFAYRDADSNGRFSYGRPFPYLPSERFLYYPDTLKLRARWPLEGLTLRFKQ